MTMEKVAAWMSRIDQNGDFDGITKETAIEIIEQWYEDTAFTDKGCKKMLEYLETV